MVKMVDCGGFGDGKWRCCGGVRLLVKIDEEWRWLEVVRVVIELVREEEWWLEKLVRVEKKRNT
jgi:hypothetical protein